ncbi:MAG: phosphotransferase family protein [Acidimicrobiia bacterium]|nr:phosphotransferase family protein [Acidimicrobiia bacterium]MDH5422618.1 phosphotransferase family protein [Acidimicrobiia bacterium]MDH5504221.1 phosphotransferase family protein [Acidimicrobiia bacterium]
MQSPELIEVRPDERFDTSAVRSYLVGRLEGDHGDLTVRQFAGGHANLTYLLQYADGSEYVLRRPPLGPVAPGSHDMAREHRILKDLWKAFPEAPRSYALCDDPTIIGTSFFVMERKGGVVVRREVPEVFGAGRDQEANRKLSEVVIDTLVRFHNIDPHDAGLGDLGHPDGFLQRQVEGWATRWHLSKEQDWSMATDLIEWLQNERPNSPAPSLVHNDWRLDNMAVSERDPGRCVAVYDWDMCTQGDPLADLGTLLSVWYDADEAPSELNPMPTTAPGFLSRQEAIDRYSNQAGISPSRVDYYVVFGSFKMAVIVQQIYIRYVRGQTRDDRFAVMGDAARHLMELAVRRRP